MRKSPAGRFNPKVNLVRYADDFIVTGVSKELLENEVRPVVEQFLRERSLELSPEKTCVTHIDQGFDFLGQNIRSWKGKLLTQPSKRNVHAFLDKVRTITRQNKALDQLALIRMLNPVIRGWVNYHRHASAKRAFNKVDRVIWKSLWRWARRRHLKKSANWIIHKYWHPVGRHKWLFAADTGQKTPDGKPVWFRLVNPTDTKIVRYRKIMGEANPYDPNWRPYFEDRVVFKKFGVHLHKRPS